MTDHEQKYVVVKKEDVERLEFVWQSAPDVASGISHIVNKNISDAVVIRLQDVFAAPGLMAYAGVVQTAIELMKMNGSRVVGGATVEDLQRIADYFYDMAHKAEQADIKKVPD